MDEQVEDMQQGNKLKPQLKMNKHKPNFYALLNQETPPTHDHDGPDPSRRNIHVFTTAAVGVQAKIVINIIVKAPV